MKTPTGSGGELRVGAVVRLGEIPETGITVHGVVAARAPWSVRTLLVVPADLMPLAGGHDLFLSGSAPADPHERTIGGLWLRGLAMFAVEHEAWAARDIEGHVADTEIAVMGEFIRNVDLRRPTGTAMDDPHRTALGLTLPDWMERVADLADPAAVSAALRARVRGSAREATLLRVVRAQERPVALAADAPRGVGRSIELRAADGRVIRIARDPNRSRVLVSSEPHDDILSVTVSDQVAEITPVGHVARADDGASIRIGASNGVVYRGRLEFR